MKSFTIGFTTALTTPNSSPMNRNVRILPVVVFEPPLTLIPVTRVAIQMATALTTTLIAKDLMAPILPRRPARRALLEWAP